MHILEIFSNIDIITHDNYISFLIINLLITLIYNDIFAAYAGSCLFGPSTASMRKGCDGDEEKWEKKKMVKIAVHYRCASQPTERRPTGTLTTHAKTLEKK